MGALLPPFKGLSRALCCGASRALRDRWHPPAGRGRKLAGDGHQPRLPDLMGRAVPAPRQHLAASHEVGPRFHVYSTCGRSVDRWPCSCPSCIAKHRVDLNAAPSFPWAPSLKSLALPPSGAPSTAWPSLRPLLQGWACLPPRRQAPLCMSLRGATRSASGTSRAECADRCESGSVGRTDRLMYRQKCLSACNGQFKSCLQSEI